MVKTFRDLTVWQKAHQLVIEVYKISKKFPVEERYGLTAQLRRSSASIPTNIVEGFKRKSKNDFAHFINIAESSLEEARYQLILAHDLQYVTGEDFDMLNNICDEIGRMLCSFYRKLTT